MFVKKLGEIRPNQLITTYGPGAIMDAVHDSLTVLDIDYWDEQNIGQEIFDTRLASYMGVRRFYMPKTGGKEDIPVRSFPYYHVCSNGGCRRLFSVQDFPPDPEEYKNKQGQVKCPECGYDAYPARFIMMCEDGHMDDFPWKWWVHRGETDCNGTLTLKSNGNVSSLAELTVRCSCGAYRTMAGALQKENFKDFKCTGHFPQRPNDKNKICGKPVIPSQRGASNVYFPVIKNAISIPPWTDPINDLIAEKRQTIEAFEQAFGEAGLQKAYEQFFTPKYTKDEFDKAYARLKSKIHEFVELKEMEYKAIIHHDDVDLQHDVKYFKANDVTLPDSLKPYFSRLIKVERLREVKVLTGYTRLESPDPEADDPVHIVKLKSGGGESWLPAVAINGEGIFIELNREAVANWKKIDSVSRRSKQFEEGYAAFCSSRGWQNAKKKDAEYVLLHTLSHLLIKSMALSSGYSSSAMHERIYSSENMCGLLIYTGAPDAEGSLGGLVELGNINKFIPLLKDALENALICTTDPECMMRIPTVERINGAACHSCSMISETACENGNRLLDRSLVVPLPEHEDMGFFRKLIEELCGILE